MPVSPVIKTVVFVPATASTWLRIERRLPRRPTIVPRKDDSAHSGLRAVCFIGAIKSGIYRPPSLMLYSSSARFSVHRAHTSAVVQVPVLFDLGEALLCELFVDCPLNGGPRASRVVVRFSALIGVGGSICCVPKGSPSAVFALPC